MRVTAKFREYENGATKGFVDLTVNGSIGIKDARLVEGPNGLFVSMPQIKAGDEYKDVVTGVSKDFADLALAATVAARDSEEKKASVGEGKSTDLYYGTRATALKDAEGPTKALATLTVRESKDAEKSAFSISNIRVLQGEKNLFLGMPNVKTDNPDFPYNDLCYFTKGSEEFLSGLVISEAMKALGIEKKPKLEERVGEAKEKAANGKKKPGKDTSQKKEKEAGRVE